MSFENLVSKNNKVVPNLEANRVISARQDVNLSNAIKNISEQQADFNSSVPLPKCFVVFFGSESDSSRIFRCVTSADFRRCGLPRSDSDHALYKG